MQRRRISRLLRAQSRLKLTFSLSLRVSYTRYFWLLDSLVDPILTFIAALCLYHDPERPPQYEEHRQILVHRKLPLALVLGKRLHDVSLPGVDYPHQEFIPHFAKAYNFQYELVTYKWPSWLRAQKEKQRIIWAYKILFLDVLFPMDLKKVIFVDADQIVRADLKELVDLDLHGAPYGYTPMGDDNVEMEGFRFWKTGYWKEDRKSTRLNSSHSGESRMPSSA